MAFLGINPNSISLATEVVCTEILYPQLGFSEECPGHLNARELADAFNIVDPEVTGLSSALEESWQKEDDSLV